MNGARLSAFAVQATTMGKRERIDRDFAEVLLRLSGVSPMVDWVCKRDERMTALVARDAPDTSESIERYLKGVKTTFDEIMVDTFGTNHGIATKFALVELGNGDWTVEVKLSVFESGVASRIARGIMDEEDHLEELGEQLAKAFGIDVDAPIKHRASGSRTS